MDSAVNALINALTSIRDQADSVLRKIEEPRRERSLAWKCTACGHVKQFTRPASTEVGPSFDAIMARRDSVNKILSAFQEQYKAIAPDASNSQFTVPFNQAILDFDAERGRFNHELFKIAKAIH